MSNPGTLTVRGFLADNGTGAGVGGLRVELWHSNGAGPHLIGASQSDDAGRFRFRLTPRDEFHLDDGGAARVELRVVDGARVLQRESHELPLRGERKGLDLTIPVFAEQLEEADDTTTAVQAEVVGRVRGRVPEGATARVVVSTLRGGTLTETVVAEGRINDAGWYRIEYERPSPPPSADVSVSVRVYDAHGELVGESTPVLSPGDRSRIDVRLTRARAGPSEFTLLEREVAELSGGAQALEGAEAEVIEEVSQWLDVDPGRLSLFKQAGDLERDTGVSASTYYALGRRGLRLSLEDLIDLPIRELRTTIEEALADRIVDPERLGDLDHQIDRLAGVVIERATAPEARPERPSLAEVLAAADIPRDVAGRVLRQYQARTGGAADFWSSFTTSGQPTEALGEDTAERVELAVRLSELVGPDPDLHRALYELRREGRWQTPEDLSRLSYDDWCDVLAGVHAEADEAEGEEAEAQAAMRDSVIEERAEVILEALEQEFRSAFIRNHMTASESLSSGAVQLMQRAPNHDFTSESIRTLTESDPGLTEGLESAEAEAAIEEIEAIERISRVTQNANELDILFATGMRSAMEIGGTSRRAFTEMYGEAVGGRAQAARIHAAAQEAAAGVKMAAVRVLQANQHVPFVLGGAVVKDVPDAGSLFQAAGGFCDCEHCGSVYSPAAYFVDLLRYLNVHAPDRMAQLKEKLSSRTTAAAAVLVTKRLLEHQPLDVLLGRRPDLSHLPLSCENTLTALPYIDLVNELLEAAITGGSAAFDTGKTPTDVLQAVPQNLSREAYQRLQEAVYPLALPYHQPLALARAYLAHLGVTRLELMKVLGRGETIRLALVAESLGMPVEEFVIVAQTPRELWRHLGFETDQVNGVPYVQALAHVPRLLDATGITFQQLIELVDMRFVNADGKMSLDAASLDCNPDKIQIAGLDEARLARMLRLIRLRRRLGWTFAVLDRALHAFGAADLDVAVLEKLTAARDLAKRLDKPLTDLLVLWAPMDAWGKDNLYERLLQTRAVLWAANDEKTFQLRPDRSELAETGPNLDRVASALLAGFRITSEDLALIRALWKRRGAEPALDLAGLSAIYRVVVLARALQLRMQPLDLLLRLVPPDADPFRAGDPAATLRFVELVHEIQNSEFTPERLAYLFRHESDPRRDPGPLAAQVDAVLANIRNGLADAFAETSRPREVTGETLRQKLALLLDPALLDAAVEVLDPRTPAPADKRREFFDRHLARIFKDPAAAASRLFVTPPEGTPQEELDTRWRANMSFTLDHLLPLLRERQLRGTIVQTLSDTLGLSAPSTARLLDGALRSRERAAEPLLRDFQAMLGTGLTGAYFANKELSGEPAVVRTDPELTFSWAGAPPAEGVPGTGFSVRWTGHLLVRTKAAYTFYVNTDGAVRVTMKIDGAERVLIDKPASAKAVDHVSEPVVLDPRRLVGFQIEYRNSGTPATFSLQYGTGPGAKHPVPTTSLHPVGGLSTLAPIELSYRRLHKASLVLTGFGVTDAQLEWLTGDPPYLNLDALPMEPGKDEDAWALFQRWRQLAALFTLRRKLPPSNVDLFEVFRATTASEALDRLVLATGWDRGTVEAFVGPDGFAFEPAQGLRPPASLTEEAAIVRLARAIDVQRRVGVAPATLYAWANTIPDPDVAAAIVQAVKARYDEKRWLEVARSLNDPLRAERRDALVTYLLPRLRDRGIRNRNQLFEYFLIDVEMNPCMLTSRVRQATATVQTFFQRALMNLEPLVPPRVIDDNDWKFLKNYRVWEANRKVFLYPENWIEPDLRDDKSPIFEVLERSILQQEIKNDNVEAAFGDYLESLDEIARLDVRGIWFERRPSARLVARQRPGDLAAVPSKPRSEWDDGTYHIFARTFNAPHVWYYRRLENGRTWTPWEKIDADIEGEHLAPVIFQRRMHLFWTLFREVNKPMPTLDRESKGPPPVVGKDWEIQLAYSVYDRGRWSRKRMSAGGALDHRAFTSIHPAKGGQQLELLGSGLLSPSDYTLRAVANESGDLPELYVYVYSRGVEAFGGNKITLSPTRLDPLARFELHGSNGALVPILLPRPHAAFIQHIVQTADKHGRLQAALGNVRHQVNTQPFHIAAGGIVTAPAGYRVHGMAFDSDGARAGSLLALPAGDARGTSVALTTTRDARRTATVVPVTDPGGPEGTGLYPFFFQDRFRSYFVRPIFTDWKPAKLVAMPFRARPIALPPPRRPVRRPRAPMPFPWLIGRGGKGRREDVEDLSALTFEGQDAWDDELDEAWHPDDAAEARQPRQRQRPQPAAAPRRGPAPPARRGAPPQPARPQVEYRREEAYHERLLQFTPFEHADTARFLSTLKAKGLEGLLDFSTTRPQISRDHEFDAQGKWALRKQNWFQQYYGGGPLTYQPILPHLDVEFDADHPYASYNWELFFHAPLQVAVRLAKDGRHEEAQRWFHFIFDPTTDSSSPSPRRYWRFAPFYENDEYASARDLVNLFSYTGKPTPIPELVRRQAQARAQLAAWWEKPFSPHVIARLRISAYQKAVVMKYIDNLVEWGDKLFRRDSMESIQEATQIYILAANILGPRPEKIPPIVSKPPLTFHQMRSALNVFSNFEVRLENLQVRRPFRISAQPEPGAATAVLSMATQYFCTPPNPQLDKYWDTVADRLFKIRNCMNIQGIVRQLALFEPPIDPGLLVRAAAAGVDLGSVIASLNAPPPHYRFRFLLDRATRLSEEIRSFGAITLKVLERKDAEGLAALRASNETALQEAVRDIRKKVVRQVEEELNGLSLEREQVQVQIDYLTTQVATLMNPQEEAQQKSLSAAQVISGIAEGVDLVGKVLHAIPEIQTGGAGAFSSPFATLQIGGQMLGDIVGAVSASFEKVMAKNETEADLAAAQAEYQRRRQEWQHELDVLAKEKAQIEKHILETQLKLEITSADLRRHDLEVENAGKVARYLRDKYTNEQLYGWMLGQVSGVYFQAYKVAFDAAQQAERAFRFERGEPSASFIEFSYWDSLKKGLLAGERLLIDLRRLEAAYVDGNRRGLEITRHISLREEYPLSWLELLETGRCQVDVTEALLDGDFPGHYFRRTKTVSLTMAGTFKPQRNVNCTLTLLENRVRTDANASGSYGQAADAEDSRFIVNVAPVQAVATSRPEADAGLFRLRFDDERYLPFEGAGAISTWRLELHQADNAVDLGQLSDAVLTLSYTARTGGAALETTARADREKGLARGALKPEARHLVSLRHDLPSVWKQLSDAPAGQEVEVSIPLDADRFSGRYRGLDVRIERATAIARPRGTLGPLSNDALRVRVDPPKGSGTPINGWAPAWPRARALRGTAEASGPLGTWKLAVAATAGKISDLLDDLVLVFDVRAKKN